MNKELIIILKHLLDKTDPEWRSNPEFIEAMITIRGASKKFSPPTIEEVIAELRTQKVRNYQEQAEKFWNFYEAKNWMIGKNKMKSWKAAIKTWNFDKNNFIV
jgi:hypothetical protein